MQALDVDLVGEGIRVDGYPGVCKHRRESRWTALVFFLREEGHVRELDGLRVDRDRQRLRRAAREEKRRGRERSGSLEPGHRALKRGRRGGLRSS